MDVKAEVLRVFQEKDTMLDSKAIAVELELDKKEVSKAIAQLKKEDLIFSPKRCFYQFKKIKKELQALFFSLAPNDFQKSRWEGVDPPCR
ncbi:hypothetical protein [Lactococcus fujiensis]|nr:hypothetical protein [Lactococcus fujiensis]